MTIATVGYGDQYPVTDLGRILGSIIIIIGVGVFGTLTGYLAQAFIRPAPPVVVSAGPSAPAPAAATFPAVQAEAMASAPAASAQMPAVAPPAP